MQPYECHKNPHMFDVKCLQKVYVFITDLSVPQQLSSYVVNTIINNTKEK